MIALIIKTNKKGSVHKSDLQNWQCLIYERTVSIKDNASTGNSRRGRLKAIIYIRTREVLIRGGRAQTLSLCKDKSDINETSCALVTDYSGETSFNNIIYLKISHFMGVVISSSKLEWYVAKKSLSQGNGP